MRQPGQFEPAAIKGVMDTHTPTSPAQYDASHTKASLEHVAAGGAPIARMGSATLTTLLPSCVTLAHVGRGVRMVRIGEEIVDPKIVELAHVGTLTAEHLATLLSTSLVDVLFVDRGAVSAATRTLASSPDKNIARLARIVTYLAKCPVVNQCAVLTSALATKFWAPEPKKSDDIGAWASWFKVGDTTNPLTAVPDLVGLATTGVPPLFDPLFRAQSGAATAALLRGRAGSTDAFVAISHLMDTWRSIENIDPILCQRSVLTGEAARIVPLERSGSNVIATISTPLKLRPGSTVLLFEPGVTTQELPVVLASLDFDSDAGMLLARFGSTRLDPFSKRQARRNGFDVLLGRESIGKEFLIAAKPYVPRSASFRPKGSGVSSGLGSTLAIPLDIALAAQ